MQVVHLHSSRGWGGGEYQIFHLLKGMEGKGVDSTLVSPGDGELYQRSATLGVSLLPLPQRNGARALLKNISSEQANLLHAHDSRALGIGRKLARGLRLPLVLSRRVASPVRRNPLSRRKYSARSVDAVIAISETVRDVFARTGYPVERIHVVPSGLDFASLEMQEEDSSLRREVGGSFIVGGIGTLSRKKNCRMLLQVAAALRNQGLNIRWLVVGDGPERGRLEELAKHLRVDSMVSFLGFREDADRILKTLDLLFFPSLMEGASVTVRKAMFLNVPVVAVRSQGVEESLAGHGWLVTPGDVAGAAAGVREALTDRDKRERVCGEARQSAVERFSIARTVGGTIDVYRRVLAGKKVS